MSSLLAGLAIEAGEAVLKDVAPKAEAAVVNAVEAEASKIVNRFAPHVVAASKTLLTQKSALEAQYGRLAQQLKAAQAQERSLENAIELLTAQLSAYAKEAGTDLNTLLKSISP